MKRLLKLVLPFGFLVIACASRGYINADWDYSHSVAETSSLED